MCTYVNLRTSNVNESVALVMGRVKQFFFSFGVFSSNNSSLAPTPPAPASIRLSCDSSCRPHADRRLRAVSTAQCHQRAPPAPPAHSRARPLRRARVPTRMPSLQTRMTILEFSMASNVQMVKKLQIIKNCASLVTNVFQVKLFRKQR